MHRLLVLIFALLPCSSAMIHAQTGADGSPREYYEIRTYQLGEAGDEAALDGYLRDALLPAYKRLGIGPVGVLHNPEADAADRRVVVIVPYANVAQMTEVANQVDQDAKYQAAAASYLALPANKPPFQRISSELLVAFDCMPKLAIPSEVAAGSDRIYELRVYESATEQLGALKVDMFNNGEVPIFLDSGIRPVFFGRAIIGPRQPNLTYLTVYADDAARQAAWQAFLSHPDWDTLKKTPKYANTVSKIDKWILVAKPYSQF